MLRIATLSVLVIGLAGCAGRLNYTGPAVPSPAAQEKTINQPFKKAWAGTLTSFQNRGYTLDLADESAGLIRLRVAGNPEPYVDCGRVVSMVATLRHKIRREYQFAAASAQTRYEQLMRGNIYDVDRQMHMDSLVDVQLQPEGRNRTRVTLGTRYLLTRTVHISNASQKNYQPIADTIAFSTRSQGAFPGEGRGTECVANGRLESEILSVIP